MWLDAGIDDSNYDSLSGGDFVGDGNFECIEMPFASADVVR